MIECQNIVKKYSKNIVLDDISLKIPENKITAIIGSNGAGKSTILAIIARIVEKNGGEVLIDEKELSSWNTRELAKRLSILKQANNINVKLTVKELVSFGRFPHSQGRLTKECENKVDEALGYIGLQHLQNKYIDELSGGQKQMAYIAMIIAQDTKGIFLDEPLNNLDMKHSVEIMKTLQNLVKEKRKTIVIVIHDINFIACYADHLIAIKNGRVIQDSSTEEVMKNDVLKDIFDINMNVKEIDGKKICLYY